jgi:hypothetical protein
MSYPEDTKSILVRNRVLEALREIAAGEDYFYTPGVVYDNFKNWSERQAYPSYCVFFGDGGEWEEMLGDLAAEKFTIIVHGEFKDDEDAPATGRKGVRDVRKAVLNDATLMAIANRVTLGRLTTDNGAGAMIGSGWFDQEFICTVSGAIDEL